MYKALCHKSLIFQGFQTLFQKKCYFLLMVYKENDNKIYHLWQLKREGLNVTENILNY